MDPRRYWRCVCKVLNAGFRSKCRNCKTDKPKESK